MIAVIKFESVEKSAEFGDTICNMAGWCLNHPLIPMLPAVFVLLILIPATNKIEPYIIIC